MATIFSLVFVLAEKTQTFKTRKKMWIISNKNKKTKNKKNGECIFLFCFHEE
jgi:hypothetical protein